MTTIPQTDFKDQLIHAARLLFQAGVMSHSGHGNMSVRLLQAEQMLLTSTGILAQLTPQQITAVTFAGQVVEGSIDPTTHEIVAMHSEVYRARPDVNAIIHTHSPNVTSFALANQPLPCAYEALLRFGVTHDIPVAAWAPRGSRESVTNIVAQFEHAPATPAVLLANHGLLAFGRDPLSVAYLIIAMEEAAELTLGARALGGEKGFPVDALEQVRRHMQQFGSNR